MKDKLFSLSFVLFCFSSYGTILDTNRMPDFFTFPVGVKGGVINRTTIYTNLSNIDNTGSMDVRSNINAALLSCPSNQVVYVPAGNYFISDTIYVPSYVTLRGAGPDKTIFWYSNYSGNNAFQGIKPYDSDNIYYPNNAPYYSNTIYSGAVFGSTNIVLLNDTNYNSIKVGNLLLIDQDNDPSYIGGTLEDYSYMGRLSATRIMKQIVEVLSVVNVTNITFTPPLVWNFTNNPQCVGFKTNFVGIGFEDFAVTNLLSSYRGGYHARFSQCKDSWMKNLKLSSGQYALVGIYNSFRCSVLDSTLEYSLTYDTANRSYALVIEQASSDCLIQNNIRKHTRSGFMAAGAGARNVFGYNFSDEGWNSNSSGGSLMGTSANHGGNPWFNLWEGNVAAGNVADLFHAGSLYNILFRNFYRGWAPGGSQFYTNNYERAINICSSNYFYSIVGNILGDANIQNPNTTNKFIYEATTNNLYNNWPYIYRLGFIGTGEETTNFDSRVITTMVRHGNYDYVNKSTIWDAGIADHTLPNSYYLSSKPDWFGTNVWPAIGPDISGMTNMIPAQLRYYGVTTDVITNTPSPDIIVIPKSLIKNAIIRNGKL